MVLERESTTELQNDRAEIRVLFAARLIADDLLARNLSRLLVVLEAGVPLAAARVAVPESDPDGRRIEVAQTKIGGGEFGQGRALHQARAIELRLVLRVVAKQRLHIACTADRPAQTRFER